MNILLIEPDKLLAQTYGSALERAGHDVRHVISAQAAVHAADEVMPDLVILELQLPRHNGIEFLYEFRSYAEWLHIPVLIHTFVPPQEFEQTSTLTRELGVVQALYKPDTKLAQLIAAVGHIAPVGV